MKNIEKILKALANKRRLAIIKFLKQNKQANVAETAEAIKLSFKATSKHLLVLYAANIVDREQISIEMYYRLSSDLAPIVKQISNYID